MAKFITNEETLRSMLPNIQMTVEGESDIYSKMLPFIETAEHEVISLFQIDPEAEYLPSDTLSRLVAYKSMYAAAPSLDCVLTPNGFAVVYNQHMLPTAKLGSENPMSKMRESILQTIFSNELRLLEDLQETEWICPTYLKGLFEIIFSPRSLAAIFNCNSLSSLINTAKAVLTVQNNLAWELVTEELMQEICEMAKYNIVPDEKRALYQSIENYIINDITKGKNYIENQYKLRLEIKNTLIRYHLSFPQWAESHIGKSILGIQPFKNKKKSSGYFF